MSLAQVKTVKRAQKDQGKCSKCGVPLPAGNGYRYYKPGFRSRVKIRRCLKPECTPLRSELESSRMSEVYSAQEECEKAIADALTESDVRDALDECSLRVQTVLDEYQASIDGLPMLEATLADFMSEIEMFREELDGVEPEVFDDPAPEKPEGGDFETEESYKEAMADFDSALAEWEHARLESLEDSKSAANDALSNI